MITMYYRLDSRFKKIYVDKKMITKLKRLGYEIYKERLI